ncbi:IgGFc-binding protein-like [Lingula anatina]|uniref:IgGFc-binding protein-like n=1 Tax=Lingula anatina TaxID=7574 RepID=A0A1S3H5I1_LINAN|nr:IgGFc-binding protein-like [Lingula anatina]|eukprot:XP_013380721.1 IgGFc-binding protein-like [Lingula anatina]
MFIYMKKKFFFMLIIFRHLFVISTFTGETSSRGTHFIVGFLEAHASCSLELWITPQVNTTLTVNVSSKTAVIHEGVGTGGSLIRVPVPISFHMTGSSRERKAISVQSSEVIVLHVRSICSSSGTSYFALPTDAINSNYCVVSYLYSLNGMAIIGVVAISDKTDIKFELPTNRNISIVYKNEIYKEGDCISETLNSYETLQIRSSDDLTGTFIKASKPITVLAGFGEFIPDRGVYTMNSVMVDQLLPSCSWGTEFMTIPVANTSVIIRVVAIEDNADIYIRTTEGKLEAFALEKSDFRDTHLQQGKSIWIESVSPIASVQITMQHMPTERPLSNILMPINLYSNSYVYATPSSSPNNYSLYIAVPEELKGNLFVDTLPLVQTGISWEICQGNRQNFSTAVMQVEPGWHRITMNSTLGFFAMLHDNGENGSFWVPLGMNSTSLLASCSSCCNLTDFSCVMKKGLGVTDSATVMYTYNYSRQTNSTESAIKITLESKEVKKPGGMHPYVLSIVISLCCAVTLVFLCILGFTIAEFYCRRDDFRNRQD